VIRPNNDLLNVRLNILNAYTQLMGAVFIMNILKFISIALSVFGLVFGLIAAWYWLKASQVSIKPAWELEIRGNVNKNIMGWVTGNMIAFKDAGDLNARAALLTAIAILFGSVGSLLSTISV
jgi:hypothetical protein